MYEFKNLFSSQHGPKHLKLSSGVGDAKIDKLKLTAFLKLMQHVGRAKRDFTLNFLYYTKVMIAKTVKWTSGYRNWMDGYIYDMLHCVHIILCTSLIFVDGQND